jgi:hypothetical protein
MKKALLFAAVIVGGWYGIEYLYRQTVSRHP